MSHTLAQLHSCGASNAAQHSRTYCTRTATGLYDATRSEGSNPCFLPSMQRPRSRRLNKRLLVISVAATW